MSMDASVDWAEPDYSSDGEYITADDGYEADIENPMNPHTIFSKHKNQFNLFLTDVSQGNANLDMCTLTIDLLIYFSKRWAF